MGREMWRDIGGDAHWAVEGRGRALAAGVVPLGAHTGAKATATKYVIYGVLHSCESMSTFPYAIPCY